MTAMAMSSYSNYSGNAAEVFTNGIEVTMAMLGLSMLGIPKIVVVPFMLIHKASLYYAVGHDGLTPPLPLCILWSTSQLCAPFLLMHWMKAQAAPAFRPAPKSKLADLTEEAEEASGACTSGLQAVSSVENSGPCSTCTTTTTSRKTPQSNADVIQATETDASKLKAVEELCRIANQTCTYVSRTSHTQVVMKLYHAEPENLKHDVVHTANQMLQATGRTGWLVTGASIRKGCTQLLLTLQRTSPQEGSDAMSSSHAAIEQMLNALLTPGMKRSSGNKVLLQMDHGVYEACWCADQDRWEVRAQPLPQTASIARIEPGVMRLPCAAADDSTVVVQMLVTHAADQPTVFLGYGAACVAAKSAIAGSAHSSGGTGPKQLRVVAQTGWGPVVPVEVISQQLIKVSAVGDEDGLQLCRLELLLDAQGAMPGQMSVQLWDGALMVASAPAVLLPPLLGPAATQEDKLLHELLRSVGDDDGWGGHGTQVPTEGLGAWLADIGEWLQAVHLTSKVACGMAVVSQGGPDWGGALKGAARVRCDDRYQQHALRLAGGLLQYAESLGLTAVCAELQSSMELMRFSQCIKPTSEIAAAGNDDAAATLAPFNLAGLLAASASNAPGSEVSADSGSMLSSRDVADDHQAACKHAHLSSTASTSTSHAGAKAESSLAPEAHGASAGSRRAWWLAVLLGFESVQQEAAYTEWATKRSASTAAAWSTVFITWVLATVARSPEGEGWRELPMQLGCALPYLVSGAMALLSYKVEWLETVRVLTALNHTLLFSGTFLGWLAMPAGHAVGFRSNLDIWVDGLAHVPAEQLRFRPLLVSRVPLFLGYALASMHLGLANPWLRSAATNGLCLLVGFCMDASRRRAFQVEQRRHACQLQACQQAAGFKTAGNHASSSK